MKFFFINNYDIDDDNIIFWIYDGLEPMTERIDSTQTKHKNKCYLTQLNF